MKNYHFIYYALCMKNSKGYVGQKQNSNLQFQKEFHEWCALKGSQKYFHRAIRKYGKRAFKWKLLCKCYKIECLDDREIYWIKKLKTKRPFGYNIVDGGRGNRGWKPNKECKEKNRKSHIKWWKDLENREKCCGKNHHMWNKQHTIESKKKNSKSQRRKWRNPEYRKRNTGKNHWNYNRHHSKKTRKKMSDNHADICGKKNPMYKKGYILKRLFKDPKNHPMFGRRKINGIWHRKVGNKMMRLK